MPSDEVLAKLSKSLEEVLAGMMELRPRSKMLAAKLAKESKTQTLNNSFFVFNKRWLENTVTRPRPWRTRYWSLSRW
jgi:hypothetical protein